MRVILDGTVRISNVIATATFYVKPDVRCAGMIECGLGQCVRDGTWRPLASTVKHVSASSDIGSFVEVDFAADESSSGSETNGRATSSSSSGGREVSRRDSPGDRREEDVGGDESAKGSRLWWLIPRRRIGSFRHPFFQFFVFQYFVFRTSVFRISYFVFRISYFVFRISYFVFRISYFVFRISYFVFRISYFVFRISYLASLARWSRTDYSIDQLLFFNLELFWRILCGWNGNEKNSVVVFQTGVIIFQNI